MRFRVGRVRWVVLRLRLLSMHVLLMLLRLLHLYLLLVLLVLMLLLLELKLLLLLLLMLRLLLLLLQELRLLLLLQEKHVGRFIGRGDLHVLRAERPKSDESHTIGRYMMRSGEKQLNTVRKTLKINPNVEYFSCGDD
jgi:hypothetical protein